MTVEIKMDNVSFPLPEPVLELGPGIRSAVGLMSPQGTKLIAVGTAHGYIQLGSTTLRGSNP